VLRAVQSSQKQKLRTTGTSGQQQQQPSAAADDDEPVQDVERTWSMSSLFSMASVSSAVGLSTQQRPHENPLIQKLQQLRLRESSNHDGDNDDDSDW